MKIGLILMSFIFVGSAFAESKPYVVGHLSLSNSSDAKGSTDYLVGDRGSYFGFKGSNKLENTSLTATYKMELGVDLNGLSGEQGLITRYLFTGLRGEFGEIRLGRQDRVYDLVDNVMDTFLTKQNNGLLSDDETKKLALFVRKFGSIGFAASYATNSKQLENSLMVNYLSGPVYLGAAVADSGRSTTIGQKWVAVYKGASYGIGLVYEKCPSNISVTVDEALSGECSLKGGDSINNISATYRFGQPYVSAQWAKNNKSNVSKKTLEAGLVLGRSKAYIEYDKTAASTTTTLGLISKF